MTFYCEKKTPRRLSEAIEAFASPELKKKLAHRPFNRFKAIETPWWLVPSADLPFFHHGKLYFDWGDKEQQSILCGYYLEKGLDPELSVIYPSKKGKSWIMNGKWQWPAFVNSCDDASFFKMMRIVKERTGLDFELHISGGYVDDPGLFDPWNDRLKTDHFIFDVNPAKESVKYRSARRDGMVLKMLNKVKSFADLQQAIREINQDQFLWLNLFAGIKFLVCPDPLPPEQEIMSSECIWKDCLSVFSSLIK